MRRNLVAGLVAVCCWAGCGEEKYEPREGPRLPAEERHGLFRSEEFLGVNVCNEDRDGAGLRRQARRETTALALLVRELPEALIKVEVPWSHEPRPPRDLTLREYAARSRRWLRVRPRRNESARVRACVARYDRLFRRLAR